MLLGATAGFVSPRRNFAFMTTKRIRGLLWIIIFTGFTAIHAWGELVATALFEPGALSSFVQGHVDDSSRLFTFHLEKGQTLEVRLLQSEAPVGITIQDPAGAELLPQSVDPYSVKAYDLLAPRTGLYKLRLDARRKTGFRLSVSLPE
jgi:hypothetical protein